MDASEREYCCEAMARAVDGWRESCEHHEHAHECPDALVSVFANGQHGIIVHDGGASHIAIDYCPWCGVSVEPPRPLDPCLSVEDGEIMVLCSGPMPDCLRNPNPPSMEVIAEADRRMRELFGDKDPEANP